jgi:signal peptidase I
MKALSRFGIGLKMRTFIVCTILFFCFLAIGCRGTVYRVATEGMLPTIGINDMLVANPVAYWNTSIQRFDIVVFQAPEETKRQRKISGDVRYVQRIIGLPNEKIEIRSNQIYINDKLLSEPFEKKTNDEDLKKDFAPLVIPNDEYFLIGDNRPGSEDSRYWKKATVNKQDIYSKIVDIKKDFYK